MTEILDHRSETGIAIPAPFQTAPIPIEPGRVDPNGHLNMAYYLVISERGLDEAWSAMGRR